MGNTTSVYPQGSERLKSACSNYQAKDDKFSTMLRWRPHSGYQFQQGFGRLSSRYSRHTGAGLGSYTHNSQAENLAEQLPYIRFPMSKITVSALGKVLIAESGNESQHPYLSEEEKATLRFLRAAISFVPVALDIGADMENASFLFAQPGKEFAVVAGKGDWVFLFYLKYHGDISGRCVRKPWPRYFRDSVTSFFLCRCASFPYGGTEN